MMMMKPLEQFFGKLGDAAAAADTTFHLLHRRSLPDGPNFLLAERRQQFSLFPKSKFRSFPRVGFANSAINQEEHNIFFQKTRLTFGWTKSLPFRVGLELSSTLLYEWEIVAANSTPKFF